MDVYLHQVKPKEPIKAFLFSQWKSKVKKNPEWPIFLDSNELKHTLP